MPFPGSPPPPGGVLALHPMQMCGIPLPSHIPLRMALRLTLGHTVKALDINAKTPSRCGQLPIFCCLAVMSPTSF